MPSLIIHNANLPSFNGGFTNKEYDAIAIDGNRIKGIGRWDDFKSLVQAGTEVIDAGGKTLMPGFNDSHIHIWKVGNLATYMLDVRKAGSLDEMLGMIETYHQNNPNLGWITARGFNEAGWKEGRMPDKNDLDKVVRDKPVYLIRTCAHIAVANTRALELSNITINTPVPDGGVVYQGDDGKPNGIFSETALGLISKNIPAYTKDELKIMVKAARKQLYSFGITAATDPAVDPLLLQAYYEMHQAGDLGFRLNAIPILLPDGGEKPYELPEYFSSGWLNVNTVKFFSDGGLSGKTAALKRHYKNTNEQGVLRLQQQQYLQLGKAAMEKGLGLATHAIGDAAIEFVIDSYIKLSEMFPDILKRIEHLGLPEEKHLELMAKHQIATSMQTIFISELGKNFRQYLDQDYLNQCYPVRSVLKNGILTALSSDAPVVSNLNPVKGIEAAVTRMDNEGFVIAADEAISVADALKAYTVSAATIGQTPQFGTLEPGQLADFIMLNRDPLSMAPADVSTLKVERTFIGGECVYES
ncbi:amidohydrolase [Mucilaginibacter sp.]|uniref:amidohydrolase n=1 Tax=Mucilaginibacter sp. TaxID=1882438 RepID=UPI00283F5A84|nr:amidohydrolase [Mucilaginibacter sp.]MDR3696354.1 amidohydrolase [Mucilaginibacter sp.]